MINLWTAGVSLFESSSAQLRSNEDLEGPECSNYCYAYMYIYMCLYIYIYIYTCINIGNHKNNVPSWLSPQWLCGNSCTWAHDVPKCMSCHKAIVVVTGRAPCFHDCIYILRPSCFCEI